MFGIRGCRFRRSTGNRCIAWQVGNRINFGFEVVQQTRVYPFGGPHVSGHPPTATQAGHFCCRPMHAVAVREFPLQTAASGDQRPQTSAGGCRDQQPDLQRVQAGAGGALAEGFCVSQAQGGRFCGGRRKCKFPKSPICASPTRRAAAERLQEVQGGWNGHRLHRCGCRREQGCAGSAQACARGGRRPQAAAGGCRRSPSGSFSGKL